MNVVSDKVEALVVLEYSADCKDHGPLASFHEGYAVLKEEVEETKEELRDIKHNLYGFWRYIREDNFEYALKMADEIEKKAIRAACEAIQVASVCKRILDLQNDVTPKQKKFCEYYLQSGNAADAARKALYADKEDDNGQN